ncbi:MAG: DUF421 domain-containing protein [Oscillospiraceae bacterium]|nr:DUF421 domain-containing protein [Oscillospiraceae bacterium]
MTVIFIRTVIIFLSIIVLMRMLGKRQLRELELSEFVVSVLLADLAANPLQDINIPLINGLLPIFVLFVCELIISGGILTNVRFRTIMCGKPQFIILNGKVMENEMRKARLSIDELMEELRSKEILNINQVKYAILETDGNMSTILFPQYQALTPNDMGLKPGTEDYPIILIEDGVLLNKNLDYIGKKKRWLENYLNKNNCSSYKEVFAMIYYNDNEIYFKKRSKKE